jgi:hypothetical protein
VAGTIIADVIQSDQSYPSSINIASPVIISNTFSSTSGIQLSNNLTFTGTGNRITGDFSNATLANRVAFQSSTTNGNTIVNAIPNGTSVGSGFDWFNNSDTTNAGRGRVSISAVSVDFTSTITGTGTYIPMAFYTGGSEVARFTESGTRYLRMASGTGGIQFGGDTAAANALDDYEEGTFTPTLVSGFSTAPTGYTAQAGRYTKIGRVVNFEVEINPDGAVANGSHWIIGGLPFTVASGPPFSGAYFVYQTGADTNAGDTWVAQQGSTNLESYTNGGATRSGNNAGMNINERIILAGFYTTA